MPLDAPPLVHPLCRVSEDVFFPLARHNNRRCCHRAPRCSGERLCGSPRVWLRSEFAERTSGDSTLLAHASPLHVAASAGRTCSRSPPRARAQARGSKERLLRIDVACTRRLRMACACTCGVYVVRAWTRRAVALMGEVALTPFSPTRGLAAAMSRVRRAMADRRILAGRRRARAAKRPRAVAVALGTLLIDSAAPS